eukprot:TRINITY_DN5273_c0_g1_i1.p1 TRINITY_DN5273_c0_g1~~TRINITY_DN5273_c0_g1_i1.p1  ORF type:complete len:273 (+),score=67.35 TRINITY_DN5273_c0_g1_i1:92-910(+)
MMMDDFAVGGQPPEDADSQIEFAISQIRNAYRQKGQQYEGELAQLRLTIQDRDRKAAEYERTISRQEAELHAHQQRVHQLKEEKAKLVEENLKMSQQTNAVKRDLAKLQSFRKAVMASFSEGNVQLESEEAGLAPSMTSQMFAKSTYSAPITQMSPQPAAPTTSENESDHLLAAIDRSLNRVNIASPAKPAPTQPETAPTAEAGTFQTTEFFKIARSRLTYAEFNEFLSAIRRLNSNLMTREETLSKASQIFGTSNKDLLVSFEQLINRHST